MNKLIICLPPRTAFRHVGCEATTQVVESCGVESKPSHRVISIINNAPTLCAEQERNQRTDITRHVKTIADSDHKYYK